MGPTGEHERRALNLVRDEAAARTTDRIPAEPLAARLHAFRLTAPYPLSASVARGGLLKRLTSTDGRLVVVSAAAGGGKTILLGQWIERDPRPAAWLQVAEDFDDPIVFLSYLTEAIGRVTPLDPRLARWLSSPAPPVRERILPTLTAGLHAAQPCLLVLDDVHLLSSEECWAILTLLLESLPKGSRLAVAGRKQPRLPLARLQTTGELLHIDTRDLAFDEEETVTLLRLRDVSASAVEVALLLARTEGWPAGLQLALLAGQGRRSSDWLQNITGRSLDIARYLTSEVLEQQDEDARSFLLATSVLERLSPSLCSAVTGDRTAGARLAALAADNVFIAALDDEGSWYRYHHLFGDLLYGELTRRDGDQVHDLHEKAAAWFEERGQTEEAIRHWLAAGNPYRAGTILCNAFNEYSAQGRMASLFRWLDLFSDDQLRQHPSLTLMAGFPAFLGGDDEKVNHWVDAALAIRVGDDLMPDGATTMRAFQAIIRASVGRQGMTKARDDAELAVGLMDSGHPSMRAGSTSVLGALRWLTGDGDGGREALLLAIEEGSTYNLLACLGALSCLSLMEADEARWEEARMLADRAARQLEEAEVSVVAPLAFVPLARARVRAHDGDPSAIDDIAVVAEVVETGRLQTWSLLLSTVVLGELALASGDLTAAARWLSSGRGTLRRWPDAGVLPLRFDRLEMALQRACRVEPLTPAERRVLELLRSHKSLREIAAEMWVSPDTLKSHSLNVYRKLGVHSRSDAVAKALTCGLLAPGAQEQGPGPRNQSTS
jgi:LuxR family transcriptional regulator, maltose regulon positive regulatory protein